MRDSPQPDNRIVAGRWWEPGGPDPDQFSVEEGLAKTLGIALGDRLTFWVSGHEVSARVTSLRQVQWDSFNVNFFVVSPPGLLGSEAASFVTSFYLPPGREALMADLQRQFPAVTPLDVDALIGQVRLVMDRGAAAVEYVFGFTLAAGLMVMLAGIQASLDQRRGEHAVLRTLGASRRRLLGGLAVEFTAAGLLAGLLGSAFAELTGAAPGAPGLRPGPRLQPLALGQSGSWAAPPSSGWRGRWPPGPCWSGRRWKGCGGVSPPGGGRSSVSPCHLPGLGSREVMASAAPTAAAAGGQSRPSRPRKSREEKPHQGPSSPRDRAMAWKRSPMALGSRSCRAPRARSMASPGSAAASSRSRPQPMRNRAWVV